MSNKLRLLFLAHLSLNKWGGCSVLISQVSNRDAIFVAENVDYFVCLT